MKKEIIKVYWEVYIGTNPLPLVYNFHDSIKNVRKCYEQSGTRVVKITRYKVNKK